jgi:Tol biopolymer transport system component
VSPDGKKIRAMVADPEYNGSLWEIGSDGNDLHRLTTVPKDLFDVAYGRWPPDGRYFLFANAHQGRTDIWAISEKPGFLSRAQTRSNSAYKWTALVHPANSWSGRKADFRQMCQAPR